MPKVSKTVKKVKTTTGMGKIFQKEITFKLSGQNEADLQAVAHKLYAMSNPLTLVGSRGRKVTMTHNSTAPVCIFNGQLKIEHRRPTTGKKKKVIPAETPIS